MADHPLRPATHRRLGRPLPPQLANGPRAPQRARSLPTPFPKRTAVRLAVCGIAAPFGPISPTHCPVTHVFLTRPPLAGHVAIPGPLDLHVLGTPPAFVLSQDQTLHDSRCSRPSQDGNCAFCVASTNDDIVFKDRVARAYSSRGLPRCQPLAAPAVSDSIMHVITFAKPTQGEISRQIRAFITRISAPILHFCHIARFS